MPIRKMRQFLDSFGVKYVTISHSPAFTAADTAKSAHVVAQELAKVVMVKIDDRMAMVVLPANRVVDLEKLAEITAADSIRLANEREFNDLFPECEHGAMPPFGNLYAIPVYADETLRKDEEIAFNAGSHSELVKMSYRDWEKAVNPTSGSFSQPRREAPGGQPEMWAPAV
jgi:Ala-tRNA(Pro) deacylase